jgi:hypothetical protein
MKKSIKNTVSKFCEMYSNLNDFFEHELDFHRENKEELENLKLTFSSIRETIKIFYEEIIKPNINKLDAKTKKQFIHIFNQSELIERMIQNYLSKIDKDKTKINSDFGSDLFKTPSKEEAKEKMSEDDILEEIKKWRNIE